MTNNFTQKEMLIRLMDQVDCFEKSVIKKLDMQTVKINSTHELAATTNGKVKLHTKIIFGLCGILITMGGWIIFLK